MRNSGAEAPGEAGNLFQFHMNWTTKANKDKYLALFNNHSYIKDAMLEHFLS